MSHTPGPWTLQNADDSDPWNLGSMWVTDASARVLIADPENNDDARLIAAAPELLAFAERVARGGHDPMCFAHPMMQDGECACINRVAVAVIAKATGAEVSA